MVPLTEIAFPVTSIPLVPVMVKLVALTPLMENMRVGRHDVLVMAPFGHTIVPIRSVLVTETLTNVLLEGRQFVGRVWLMAHAYPLGSKQLTGNNDEHVAAPV